VGKSWWDIRSLLNLMSSESPERSDRGPLTTVDPRAKRYSSVPFTVLESIEVDLLQNVVAPTGVSCILRLLFATPVISESCCDVCSSYSKTIRNQSIVNGLLEQTYYTPSTLQTRLLP